MKWFQFDRLDAELVEGIDNVGGFRERRSLRMFGLSFCWSDYRGICPRPTSGAPIGIRKSFWIFTKRHAWGYGQISDWAELQYIDIQLQGFPPIATETGFFGIQPAITCRPRHQLSGTIANVTNRNTCAAVGAVRLSGYFECPDGSRNTTVSQFPFLIDAKSSVRLAFTIGHPTPLAPPSVPAPFVVEWVRCITEPSPLARAARIYGRPEWSIFRNIPKG